MLSSETWETVEKIMTSDDFVLDEVKKIRTLYALKKEIRYGKKRIHEADTESVAEHICAIHSLIDYFLPLENPENTWDKLKILEMAQYHDIDEIETGDIVSHKKTKQEYDNEKLAADVVIKRLPSSMQGTVGELVAEFDNQKTTEAKFVKAIDKLESLIHTFDEEGKATLHKNKFTKQFRINYIGDCLTVFPILSRFEEVLMDVFEKGDYFYSERDKIK